MTYAYFLEIAMSYSYLNFCSPFSINLFRFKNPSKQLTFDNNIAMLCRRKFKVTLSLVYPVGMTEMFEGCLAILSFSYI